MQKNEQLICVSHTGGPKMRDKYSGNLGQVDQFAGPLWQRGLRILSIFVARM